MKVIAIQILGLLLILNISYSQSIVYNEDNSNTSSAVGNAIQLSITANASLTVLKGVSIAATGPNALSFGDIFVTSSTQVKSISNELGQQFLIQGNPGSNVIINFSTSATLSNSLWALQNGGTQGTISFSTNPLPVHTLSNSNYISPVIVNNGSSVVLTNSNGTGKLYLWVGGNITVNANQPTGDYIGYFNINVSY